MGISIILILKTTEGAIIWTSLLAAINIVNNWLNPIVNMLYSGCFTFLMGILLLFSWIYWIKFQEEN